MTGKILDEILEAEKRASDIKKAASSKASEMISDAKLSGEALCREAYECASAKKKNLANEIERARTEILEQARTEAESKALIVCAAASANIPDAVNFIIGKVGSIWQ